MENSNHTRLFGGLLVIKEIVENPDGSSKIVFEADDAFRKGFKEYYGLKKWSQKKFNEFMNEAIQSSIEYYRKKELEEKNENNQSIKK